MSIYRVLPSRDFKCENEHEFRALVLYEYSTKKAWFEVTYAGNQFIEPVDRAPRSALPICPVCQAACSFEDMIVVGNESKLKNVCVTDKEAAAIAIHPVTGEEMYCFDRPDAPMPKHLAAEGYVKVQLNSFKALERFCRERGVVNDIEGDWKHEDGYFQEDLARRRKIEREQRERYMEERDKVRRAQPELSRDEHRRRER